MVEKNQGLVWSVVRRFYDRGYDLEDLFQIGAIGLIKAIKNFRAEYQTQFSTYAVPMIIGEIKRFLRDDGMIKVSRRIKELRMKVIALQKEYECQGKEVTLEELATKLQLPKEEIVVALDVDGKCDSLDRQYSEEDDSPLQEKIALPSNEYAKVLNHMELQERWRVLNGKEKKVVYYRYFQEKKQSEIAELLGVTQVQISRIEKKALQKMRECMSVEES